MKSLRPILALALAAVVAGTSPVLADSYGGEEGHQVARGRIVAMQMVTLRSGANQTERTGAAIVGGIAGAILGNQFGRGSGKTLMTGAGAVGGAMLGSQLAQNAGRPHYVPQWTVRLDHGGELRILQESHELHVGERVHVVRDGRSVRIER